MSRKRHNNSDADFENVTDFLKRRGSLAQPVTPNMLTVARKIHRHTYSLILWKFRLEKLPAHGQVFIDELASDALQILPQVLSGYNKSSKLLTRGIIENVVKHVYFCDHPVEFARMHLPKKWYITVSELFDYMKHHPAFDDTRDKFDAVANLAGIYSELSEFVHGGTVRHLEMKEALEEIAVEIVAADLQEGLLRRGLRKVLILSWPSSTMPKQADFLGSSGR